MKRQLARSDDVTIRRSASTSSTNVPSAGRWTRMSSISRSRCRAVVSSAIAQCTLARWSRTRTAKNGSAIVNNGRTRIAGVSWRLGLAQVASVHGEPGRAGEGQPARRIVVHPVLLDGRQVPVAGAPTPPSSAHDPSPAMPVRPRCRRANRCSPMVADAVGRLGEHDGGLVDVTGQQERLGQHAQRRVAPGAPGRFLRSRQRPSASICSGPSAAHH